MGIGERNFHLDGRVLCVGLGLIALRYYKTPRKIIFAISMIAASSIVSFVLLESLVRLISPPNMFSPYLPLRPHNKMELYVNLSGVSSTALNTTNQWGLRGDEPPEHWNDFFTIVVIGGVPRNVIILMTTRRGHIFSRKK